MPHPVKGIGRIISTFEWLLRFFAKRPIIELIAGIFMAIAIPSTIYFLTYYIIHLSGIIDFYAGIIATIYLGYTTIATGDLIKEARTIERKFKSGDLEGARSALARIVSRETYHLDKRSIIKGTIESVAENSSDGVVAPLFYMAIGGVPLAMAYKAVNTLDSMIGYRTERYLRLGWASARLDDLVNYMPARITGLLIAISSIIMRKSSSDAIRIMLRDGDKHESPNAGVPEAAMAGALGVQLGGPNIYFGVLKERATIGDPTEELDMNHIKEAIRITYCVSFLMIVAIIALLYLFPFQASRP